jgi:hypothetical protein
MLILVVSADYIQKCGHSFAAQMQDFTATYSKMASGAAIKAPSISSYEEQTGLKSMPRYYEPDLTVDPNSPFIRDAANKLVRRGYWMDMNDRTLAMVMTQGIGANLTNDEKRAHLIDLKRDHLIDQVCIQEVLPPER